MKRFLHAALIALSLVCLVMAITIVWILRAPARGEAAFRDDFEGIRFGYVVKPVEQRVLDFGGRAGIPNLIKIEADPKVSPAGKNMARIVREQMETNQHVPELKTWLKEFESLAPDWSPYTLYIRYVIWKDEE